MFLQWKPASPTSFKICLWGALTPMAVYFLCHMTQGALWGPVSKAIIVKRCGGYFQWVQHNSSHVWFGTTPPCQNSNYAREYCVHVTVLTEISDLRHRTFLVQIQIFIPLDNIGVDAEIFSERPDILEISENMFQMLFFLSFYEPTF